MDGQLMSLFEQHYNAIYHMGRSRQGQTQELLAKRFAIGSIMQQLTEKQFVTDDVLLAKLEEDAKANPELVLSKSGKGMAHPDRTKARKSLRDFIAINDCGADQYRYRECNQVFYMRKCNSRENPSDGTVPVGTVPVELQNLTTLKWPTQPPATAE
jgi:hypothetical protein